VRDFSGLPGEEQTGRQRSQRPLLYAGLVVLCLVAAVLIILIDGPSGPDADQEAKPDAPPQREQPTEPPPGPAESPRPPPPPEPEPLRPVETGESLLPPPEKAPPPIYPMGLKPSDLRRSVFSPDGMALRSTAARNTTILDLAIGKRVRLTAQGEACAWSPDSQWLLYWHRGWCVVRRDGKVNRRVTTWTDSRKTSPHYVGNLPIWHPDGPSVLLCDGERFRLVSVQGDRDRQIATTAEIPIGKRAGYPDFAVGAGGKWIVYWTAKRVGFLRSDGSGHRVAVRTLYNCTAPKWSAGGESAVVLADITKPQKAKQAWLIHLPSGHLIAVCKRDPIRTRGHTWFGDVAPDAAWVAYVADSADQPRIVLIDTLRQTMTKIHGDPDAGPLHVSPDGKWLAYASSAAGRGVVALRVDEARGVRLSAPLLVQRTVPVIQEWTADSRAIVFQGPGFTRCLVSLDGTTCRRIWPGVWDCPLERTPFETNRVPLEKEDLVSCDDAFEQVKTAAEYLPSTSENLPTQVVIEQ